VLVAVRFLPLGQDLSLSPAYFWLTLLTFLPAFVMIAALMAMVGATVTETREAQQVAGLFSLPLFVPLWFITPLLQDPNSTLALVFTFIPFTAPLTLPLRAAYSTVPLWQSALSIGLLFASAIGAMWLAGRVFRMGMLRYGKRLSLKEIFKRS
jgi:ABC-2 type transport system permease protein